MAYVEEYGGSGRRRRKSTKRQAHNPSPARNDWRSNIDPSPFQSPYRAHKPDLQSSESRTSSREWSRTDSSRAPASTMPSSLHTSRSFRRTPGASAESIRYRHKRDKPRHEGHYDDDEDKDETSEGKYTDSRRTPLSRRSHDQRGASPSSTTRHIKSAYHSEPSHSHADLHTRLSQRSLSESELSGDDRNENYGEECESNESENESEITGDGSIHNPKMPTIPEDEARNAEKPAVGVHSKSTSRPPLTMPEHNTGEVSVSDESTRISQVQATSAIDSRDVPGAEVPLVAALGLSPAPSVPIEENTVTDDYSRRYRRHSHKSRSRELAETKDIKPRHTRRRSRHSAAIDIDPEIDRRHRAHYSKEDVDKIVRRKSQQFHHGHRTRPTSPLPTAYHSYSPERSHLETPLKARRRRMSMDDARPRRRHHSAIHEQIHATPLRRAYTSGPHMASSYSVSTSKRSSFFGLGNMLGLSNNHQASPPKKSGKLAQCLVCMDDFTTNEISRLKCGHHMCTSCLQRSFELSLTDPSHMPPRCCGDEQIPLSIVEHLFDTKFKKRWNRKLTEYTMKNPTYCASKNCGALISPANITKRNGFKNKMGTCPKCHTDVCATCKGKWHGSKRCRNDPDANSLLDKAKQEGWPMQRCHKCGRVVELSEGCNHMQCVCGAEFCMMCGTKWKKCDCPWFNFDEEDDGLDFLHIEHQPRHGNPFAPATATGRVAPPRPHVPHASAPLRPMRLTSGFSPSPARPRSSHRAPPAGFENEFYSRQQYYSIDDERPRRRRAAAEYEHDDMLDIIGVGNTAGHFLNDNYMRATPPTGNVPPMMPRISSLHRATAAEESRFVETSRHKLRHRTSSLERRLADRLGDSQLKSIPFESADPHAAPPAPRCGGPTSILGGRHVTPMAQAPRRIGHVRRDQVLNEDNLYDEEIYPSPVHFSVSRRRGIPEPLAEGYFEEPLESQLRRSEPPKSSVMAGLSGDGRGMNRVFEWRTHVMPGYPDDDSVAA